MEYKNTIRFVHLEYSTRDVEPIDAHKKHSVLTLDTTLEPVSCCVPQLEHYKERAKHKCYPSSECDLTDDESAAIYLFMDGWGDKSLHRVFNRTLQSTDKKMIESWLHFLNYLKRR